MNTIWKFPFKITDHVVLRMPKNATILHVDHQHGSMDNELCLWALVDPEELTQERHFLIYGTGHNVDLVGAWRKHIASVQVSVFVWHIFDDVDES